MAQQNQSSKQLRKSILNKARSNHVHQSMIEYLERHHIYTKPQLERAFNEMSTLRRRLANEIKNKKKLNLVIKRGNKTNRKTQCNVRKCGVYSAPACVSVKEGRGRGRFRGYQSSNMGRLGNSGCFGGTYKSRYT